MEVFPPIANRSVDQLLRCNPSNAPNRPRFVRRLNELIAGEDKPTPKQRQDIIDRHGLNGVDPLPVKPKTQSPEKKRDRAPTEADDDDEVADEAQPAPVAAAAPNSEKARRKALRKEKRAASKEREAGAQSDKHGFLKTHPAKDRKQGKVRTEDDFEQQMYREWKPVLDKNNQPIINEKTGKPKMVPSGKWLKSQRKRHLLNERDEDGERLVGARAGRPHRETYTSNSGKRLGSELTTSDWLDIAKRRFANKNSVYKKMIPIPRHVLPTTDEEREADGYKKVLSKKGKFAERWRRAPLYTSVEGRHQFMTQLFSISPKYLQSDEYSMHKAAIRDLENRIIEHIINDNRVTRSDFYFDVEKMAGVTGDASHQRLFTLDCKRAPLKMGQPGDRDVKKVINKETGEKKVVKHKILSMPSHLVVGFTIWRKLKGIKRQEDIDRLNGHRLAKKWMQDPKNKDKMIKNPKYDDQQEDLYAKMLQIGRGLGLVMGEKEPFEITNRGLVRSAALWWSKDASRTLRSASDHYEKLLDKRSKRMKKTKEDQTARKTARKNLVASRHKRRNVLKNTLEWFKKEVIANPKPQQLVDNVGKAKAQRKKQLAHAVLTQDEENGKRIRELGKLVKASKDRELKYEMEGKQSEAATERLSQKQWGDEKKELQAKGKAFKRNYLEAHEQATKSAANAWADEQAQKKLERQQKKGNSIVAARNRGLAAKRKDLVDVNDPNQKLTNAQRRAAMKLKAIKTKERNAKASRRRSAAKKRGEAGVGQRQSNRKRGRQPRQNAAAQDAPHQEFVRAPAHLNYDRPQPINMEQGQYQPDLPFPNAQQQQQIHIPVPLRPAQIGPYNLNFY
jgi:hypothetical protein